MFKNEADFEKKVCRLKIDDKPNRAHRENLRREMLSTFEKTGRQPGSRAAVSKFMRNSIMKDIKFKLAAAAVIILALGLAIHQYAGSISLTTVSLAQMQDAINEASWLHMMFTGEGRDERDVSGIWVGFEEQIFAMTQLDGSTRHVDLSKAVEHNYDPGANTILATAVNKGEFEFDLSSPWATIQSMIGNLTDKGATAEQTKADFEGSQVNVITLKHSDGAGSCTCKVYIDTESHLIVGGRQKWESSHDDEIVHSLIKVEYPEDGPHSIFDLGVPSTAKFVNKANGTTEHLPQ